MSSRTSARQASASSPPRNQAAARTRNLRSRSESVDPDTSTNQRAGKRSARQSSAGSVASNTSTSKIQGKGKGKGKSAKSTDLSALQEEPGSESPGSDEIMEFEDFDDSSQAPSVASRPKEKGNNANARLAKQMFLGEDPNTIPSSSRSDQPSSSRIPAKASSSRNNEGDPAGTSTEEVAQFWQQNTKDNNKENTRPQKEPGREKAQEAGPSNKRGFVPEEEESQDDGFQSDTRVPDPARKRRQPAAKPAPRPAKRTRVEVEDSESASDRPRQRREQEEDSEPEQESEAPPSPPVATQVKIAAKINVEKSTMPDRKVQVRTPWSPSDEALLIKYIGEHGCRWSFIANLEGWEARRDNFQVQLKDKARNIKVSYLKARQQIPLNFTQVRLGKKEVDSVRRIDPDYDQDAEVEV